MIPWLQSADCAEHDPDRRGAVLCCVHDTLLSQAWQRGVNKAPWDGHAAAGQAAAAQGISFAEGAAGGAGYGGQQQRQQQQQRWQRGRGGQQHGGTGYTAADYAAEGDGY